MQPLQAESVRRHAGHGFQQLTTQTSSWSRLLNVTARAERQMANSTSLGCSRLGTYDGMNQLRLDFLAAIAAGSAFPARAVHKIPTVSRTIEHPLVTTFAQQPATLISTIQSRCILSAKCIESGGSVARKRFLAKSKK